MIGPIASIIIGVFIAVLPDLKKSPRGVSEREKKNMLNSDTGDFASQLRRQTATKNDLKQAQEDSVRRQIQRNVDTVLRQVKDDAMRAAKGKGRRTLKEKYKIYTYEGKNTFFGEGRIADETARELTSRLISAGFRSVNVYRSKDSGEEFCVSVSIDW